MKCNVPIVTLVYRDKREATYSIERLFKSLEPYFEAEFSLKSIVLPHRPNHIFNILRNVLYVYRNAQGLIHVTGDVHYILTFLPFCKSVLTIHDCGHLMHLKGLKKWVYKWFWFKFPCRIASLITTISTSTREVLEREVGNVYSSKVEVVENCLPEGLQKTQNLFNSECPRILQIGTGHHKNLDGLIKAVVGIPCELKIVGRISEEDKECLESGKIHYTNEYDVSNARLREIYAECDMLFFVSRHEGFGLPILEAQQVGLPVVTSNRYSMPHVVGEGGIVCDPESIGAIRSAILELISNPSCREKLVLAGVENIKRFTPAQIAEKYLSYYKTILGRN
jgi:glycosyltransferase involved in cell wall biosynthesis